MWAAYVVIFIVVPFLIALCGTPLLRVHLRMWVVFAAICTEGIIFIRILIIVIITPNLLFQVDHMLVVF